MPVVEPINEDALLQACLETLHTAFVGDFNDLDATIGIQCAPGMPPPMCNDIYMAVWFSSLIPLQNAGWLGEEYEVVVTITKKLGVIPTDRRGNIAWGAVQRGLWVMARKVIVALHGDQNLDYGPINRANELLGDTVNGHLEVLRVQPIQAPSVKGPDWFSALQPDGNPLPNAPAGMSLDVPFRGAKRMQTIESMV